jgi:hypothetical protein
MDRLDNDVDEFSNASDGGDPRVIEEHQLVSGCSSNGDTENEDEHIERMRGSTRVPAPTAESAMSNRLERLRPGAVDAHRSSIGEDPRFGSNSAIVHDSPSKKNN